mgnify:CR=1 FL=1
MSEYSTFGGVEEDNTVINLAEVNIDKVKDIGEKVANTAENIIETPMIYNIIRLIFRYLIQGFVVAIAGYYIPSKKPEWNELIMISLVAASTFAILEIYMPDAYLAARFGFGFATGSNLIPKIV